MRIQTVNPLHYRDRLRRPRGASIPGPLAGVLVLVLALISMAVVPPHLAGAATQTVTNCNDSGVGSLRQAILDAASGDTVTFGSLPCTTITLSTTIDITTNLTVDGPGSESLAVSGNGAVELFDVASGVTATISGLTMEDGMAIEGGAIDNAGTLTISDSTVTGNNASEHGGGGVLNEGGTLTISASTLSGNDSYHGGGGGVLNHEGMVTITNSTLSGNDAFYGGQATGGGAVENTGGTVMVVDSTVSGNSADYNGGGGGILDVGGAVTITAGSLAGDTTSRAGAGGGIRNEGGSVSMAATIVTASRVGGGCIGKVTDAGYNLDDDGSCGFSAGHHSVSDVNPFLGPLQDNGGPTETKAPALGSATLDQIPPGTMGNSVTLCPGTDQRGVARPQGTECDMGAVELSPTSEEITSADSATAADHVTFSFTVTTTGTPVPALTLKHKLPKLLTFVDNGNGTATIAGLIKKSGVFHTLVEASYPSGATTFVVTQVFTLTVEPG
jgi:hypothetical protein